MFRICRCEALCRSKVQKRFWRTFVFATEMFVGDKGSSSDKLRISAKVEGRIPGLSACGLGEELAAVGAEGFVLVFVLQMSTEGDVGALGILRRGWHERIMLVDSNVELGWELGPEWDGVFHDLRKLGDVARLA
jgi:hypothetical protein